MYFNKIPPAVNFRCHAGSRPLLAAPHAEVAPEIDSIGGNVFRLRVRSPRWTQSSQAPLTPGVFSGEPSRAALTISSETGEVCVAFDGHSFLRSSPDRAFGVLGDKWAFAFEHADDMRFYGLGEKNTGFEKTGHIAKFWNTDAFFDFGPLSVEHESTDPLYASIPYLLIKRPGACVGILINNPGAAFMNLGARENIANLADSGDAPSRSILLGSYDGEPEIWFLVGPDVRDVTRRLHRLCGCAPLPPLWALGYHQCRFGYKNLADLEELDARFDEHGIPCDGLWLDIDYMRGFRVFTVDPAGFAHHLARIRALQEKGRRIIPILDPGVKQEPGYSVFEDGVAADVFCRTCEGDLYSGFVWPGRTAFPDYSLARVRDWWAGHVRRFTERYRFDAYWIDMNDPSTGSAELEDMLFDGGRADHSSYHNQYALGMAEATSAGLRAARPSSRPFVLSRSAFIGSSRHAAVWTGDNWSNYRHLREGISMSLNLSLSGIAFNGPDVPGFAGNATPELAVDWHKACFLFPFLRNHSVKDCQPQEPWRFPAPQREAIAHYIRLRYKFIPYLYQLFLRQEECGEPILRPLFYEFPEDGSAHDNVGDQFMVGSSVLQAPVVQELNFRRHVRLPSGDWFDARGGVWLAGDRSLEVATTLESTPCFIRGGSVIPMLRGERFDARKDLAEVELHVFAPPRDGAAFSFEYVFDDGETAPELLPPVTRLVLGIRVEDERLYINVERYTPEHRPLSVQIVTYDPYESVDFGQEGLMRPLELKPDSLRLTGTLIAVHRSPFFTPKSPVASSVKFAPANL